MAIELTQILEPSSAESSAAGPACFNRYVEASLLNRVYPNITPILQEELGAAANVGLSLRDLLGNDLATDRLLIRLAVAAHLVPAVDDSYWTSASIDEVVQHLVSFHHTRTRLELSRLAFLIDYQLEQPGASRSLDAALRQASHLLGPLREGLSGHMLHEENELFPCCIEIDRIFRTRSTQGSQHLVDSVRRFARNHRNAGEWESLLQDVQHMTALWPSEELPPAALAAQACVRALAQDLRIHMQHEDEILLPATMFTVDLLVHQRLH